MVRALGTAGLPPNVVATLNAGVAEAVKTPKVMDLVVQQGLIPVGSNSADFAVFQNGEIAKYRKIITDANIKIDH